MAAPLQDCAVLLGDSLTGRMDTPSSFSQRMHEVYSRKLDILNRGFGGYNSSWVLQLMPKIFASKEDSAHAPAVRLVTIWLGTNDSVLPHKEQYVPLPDFIANMHAILDGLTSPQSPYAVAATPVNIVLITPAPCLHAQMEVDKRRHRSLERTGEFREAVLQIGKEWKTKEADQKGSAAGWRIATIDLWDAMVRKVGGTGDELAPFFFDGVHFSTEGYSVLWDLLVQVIETDFKGRGLDFEDEEDLPMRAPSWADIDPKRPETVLERMRLPACRQ